jgi:hypothetical protein
MEATMDSYGKLFEKGELKTPSALYGAYEGLAADGFGDLDRFSKGELDWLQRIHDKHLAFFKEERRMHFGAFALVGLSLLILLPAVLTAKTDYFLPLAGVWLLLLVLLVPYTFVYRRYEEGVRRKMRESVILENERRLRVEQERDS